MSNEKAMVQGARGQIERVLIEGDLSGLTAPQREEYYFRVCESLGLNPYTKPFAYLKLNQKLVLYALRDCADQLRKLHGVSIEIVDRRNVNDVYVVTARATLPDGRKDESTGVVALAGLRGENLANALMKAETKAKRRVTLSICGLGMNDESEMEDVKGAQRVDVASRPLAKVPALPAHDPETGEIPEGRFTDSGPDFVPDEAPSEAEG